MCRAAIALGPELARYLDEIVPPVLACFTDQDARVRYYACESMYNIAKVAKGEVLPYFNDIFDALCKVREIPPYSITSIFPFDSREISLEQIRNFQSRMEPSCSIV